MDQDDLPFEQAFGQLERTVAALEGGNLSLERAIELYEQGMQLVRRCNTVLDGAELRVRQLEQDGGKATVWQLDESQTSIRSR